MEVSFEPKIVLLDIGLPGLDGYEVARILRETYGTSIRIVALTGYGTNEDKRAAQAAGFDNHLTKPVSIADIEAVLAKYQNPH